MSIRMLGLKCLDYKCRWKFVLTQMRYLTAGDRVQTLVFSALSFRFECMQCARPKDAIQDAVTYDVRCKVNCKVTKRICMQ